MAGAYPDNPSRRMAFDADGTVVMYATAGDTYSRGSVSVPTTPYTELTLPTKEAINSEDINTSSLTAPNTGQWSLTTTLMFPEPREVDGLVFGCETALDTVIRWSATSPDTTNGFDGSWSDTSILGSLRSGGYAADFYRTNISTAALSSKQALMVFVGAWSNQTTNWGYLYFAHVYGTITPGETPDRLIFLDTPNNDAVFSKPLDWGDVPRGQTQVRQFKVKNNSSSKQANTVQITADSLFLGSDSWYTFSLDSVSFQATLPIGNLGVGATKQIHMKQVVPDAQTVGPYVARIRVNQDTWT